MAAAASCIGSGERLRLSLCALCRAPLSLEALCNPFSLPFVRYLLLAQSVHRPMGEQVQSVSIEHNGSELPTPRRLLNNESEKTEEKL